MFIYCMDRFFVQPGRLNANDENTVMITRSTFSPFHLLIALSTVLAALPSPVHAWGTQGHQVVANIAQAKLTARARAKVDRLLAIEPGETLASISSWADEHRNPATAPWHFVNFPRDSCTYDAERDCPGGTCVVGAIERQMKLLSSDAPDDRKLLAFKYVVHFVGDVHQPLHAGYLDDKGGNTYQLQAFMRGSNLHALWDVGLIRNVNEDVAAMTNRLLTKPPSAQVGDLNVAQAAEESCRIVESPGFYPERRVGLDYVERFTPIMEERLALPGARLAEILNNVFK